MDIKKLQGLVVEALEDVKAQDIVMFDTVHLTSLFDRVAIASGTSNRQTKALAASVRDKIKLNGGTILSIEGESTGEWVLVDMGDMIVHIMQPAIRAYYRLEEIWGDKPVKFGAAKRVSKRTATEEEPVPKKTGGHLTVPKPTTDDTPKKRAARKADDETGPLKETKAPAKRAAKPAVKKPAAKKPAKKAVGKTVKVSPTKTASTAKKKAPARKAPAKRAAKAKTTAR